MDYLMISLGAVIALLERYVSAKNKFKGRYDIVVFLGNNVPLFLFNLIAGIAFVIALNSANPDFAISAEGWDVTLIVWLCVGALAHYIWKLLISGFKVAYNGLIKKLIKTNGNDYNNRNSR